MFDGPKKRINILLPQEFFDRLTELASQTGYTLPGYIRQVLWRYLRRMEANPGDSDDGWIIR